MNTCYLCGNENLLMYIGARGGRQLYLCVYCRKDAGYGGSNYTIDPGPERTMLSFPSSVSSSSTQELSRLVPRSSTVYFYRNSDLGPIGNKIYFWGFVFPILCFMFWAAVK